jgi:hypothetical protein
MALPQKAERASGDYLDLKELAADGPVLAIFRIVEFKAPEKGDFGMKYDVVADALICSGPRAGEVALGETFIGAATNTLRGVTAKATTETGAQPTKKPGDEIVARVEVIKKGKQPEFVALNVPSDVEFDAAIKVYDDGRGWDNVGPAKTPVAAGAANGAASGSVGDKPWM